MAQKVKLPYHRKYRPATLAEYIGNDKLKQTALSALQKEIRPQVIMLEGASGCGKTTFARLLAKEYLCEQRNEVTGACGVCPSCTELDDYIHTGNTDMLANVREIDIADQSGKRDLDGIIEEIYIPSFGGQWRVFIFDECHMSSPQQQNRLLKLAEEPPENVLMIFCTTDPQMVIETLRNRCQLRLHVKKPTVAELGGLLKRVCSIEGVDCDTKGVNFVANRSELTIRKALTNLEQVVNEKGSATYESAIEVFEEVSDKLIVTFYKKLIGVPEYASDGNIKRNSRGEPVMRRDVLGYVTLLHKIRTQTELKLFLQSLVDFTKRGIYIVNQIQLDGVSDGELVTYRDLFGDFTVEQMAVLVSKLISMTNAPDVEAQLLLLGYTGLTLSNSTGDLDIDSGLDAISSEVTAEHREESKNRERAESELKEQGLLEADDLVKGADIDIVQALFGGVDVVN